MGLKSFPKGPFRVGVIGEIVRILDGRGRDIMRLPFGPERLVECANALRSIHYPENHVSETEAYVKRLEGLRREAAGRITMLEDGGAGGGWNFDIDQAPKGKSQIVGTGKTDKEGRPVMKEVHVAPRIIAAGSGDVVTLNKWLPAEERWEMFTKDHPPIAWQPWPDHPHSGADS